MFRFISELASWKVVREVKSGLRCAMSLLEDVIPFGHISAGVCAVSGDMGLWDFPKMHNDGWE